jgi:hypothetical protein
MQEVLRRNNLLVSLISYGPHRKQRVGGIYEAGRCHDIHTKFHKDWLRHSKDNSGGSTDA